MVSSFAAGFLGGLGDIVTREKEARELREAQMEQIMEKRHNQLIPYLMKKRQTRTALASEQNRYRSWFMSRLGDDVDETTKEAFVNLAASDPKVSDSLVSSIQKFEEETNRRLTGPEILQFTNIIEQTRPEDTPLEQWTEYAATQLKPSTGGIDFDATLERLLGADQEELYELQAELMTPVSPAISFEPDINRSAFLGMDPAEREQYRKQLGEASMFAYRTELEQLNTVLNKTPETPASEEDQKRYNYLQRMQDQPERITREYLPLVGPNLAEADPGFKRFYETFSAQTSVPSTSTQVIEYVYDEDGNLVVKQ